VDFVEYVSKVHPMDQNLIAGFLFDAVGGMRPAHRPAPLIDSGCTTPRPKDEQ
jgi:hypothetical protein